MSSQRFRIGKRAVTASDPGWQTVLAEARRIGQRPRCLCTESGVDMYIASAGGHLIVKRMPLSGATHAPGCESFTPPAELSGLGPLLGAAIEDDGDQTKLKLAFALSLTGAAPAPAADSEPGDTVASDPARLSMRAAVHYLWEQAGFTRSAPSTGSAHTWPVVRRALLGAARDKTTKGRSLLDSLYLPEAYDADHRAELAARHTKVMRMISAEPARGRTRLMLLLGEVAAITPGRIGHRMILTQLPEFPILLADDLHHRLNRRFSAELEMWDANEDTRLVVAGTISASRGGVPSVHELTLMTVTGAWIPYESMTERLLLDHLIDQKRSWVKGLRYNLPESASLATAVLTDTDPATALYLCDGDQRRRAIDELIADSELSSWIWDTATDLPPLPEIIAHDGISRERT